MKEIVRTFLFSALALIVWFVCFRLFSRYCFFGGLIYYLVILCFWALAVFLILIPLFEITAQIRENRARRAADDARDRENKELENAAIQKVADLVAGKTVSDLDDRE